MRQKAQAILCVLMSIFVKYDGNFADAFCEVDFVNSSQKATPTIIQCKLKLINVIETIFALILSNIAKLVFNSD